MSKISSLYRRALKTSLNWYVDRISWRHAALEIRARFEANRNVTSTQELRKIILAAEKELEENSHPDPYKYPTAPGGTKWERNIPPPLFGENPEGHH
ncbi:NDUFB9, NADH-ubiquinone oxidoreductase [Rhizophagus clarus]|uniref:NADH dehydrogenase [ubiquinone] 1 beta subcomplex subunit 9 n=1 Tax=Rhizophagus clarus TaxID=94130 RepID=A0A8H3LU44_9GLOM|nr:NDUFB9, NADH-ubiquinone oxidoreductase [Rhizophagus clarus]